MSSSYWLVSLFLIFMIVVALITWWKVRGSNFETSDGYFLAGRSLSGWVIAGSLLMTNLQASNFVGMSANAYDANMAVMGYEVGSGLTLILVALFLVPRYLKQGITTIPDFIESRFGAGTRNLVTALFLLLYVVNLVPVTLYAGAVALSGMFNVPEMFGISQFASIVIFVWIIGLVGGAYAVFGGLKAVCISDSINGVALIFGGLAVPLLGFWYLGSTNGGGFSAGMDKFLHTAPEKFNAIGGVDDPNLPITAALTGLVLVNLYYWGTDQSVIQRALGARNLAQGQKGVLIAGLLKVLTPFMLIIPGVMAAQSMMKVPDGQTSDSIYPLFTAAVLPVPVLAFVAAALMGAILSTFNSVLNSASTLFATNVYKPFFKGEKTELQVVKSGKWFAISIGLAGLLASPFLMYTGTGLFTWLQTVNGFFNVPIFTIIFLGYVTKRVSSKAANVGLVFFVVLYGLSQTIFKPQMVEWKLHFMHISAILFVVTSVLILALGRLWPRDTDFVLPTSNVVEMTPWAHRFSMGGFVLGAMLSMYVVFSPFGLASGNGLSPLALASIVSLLVGGSLLGFWADRRWPAQAPSSPETEKEEALVSS
ncbi:MAG: solute:sodium symporter family transporter [Propionibacteriaceae bacterium]|nr:solute:sodium symporter family transporter [Propionibacteriaceae bacterium]